VTLFWKMPGSFGYSHGHWFDVDSASATNLNYHLRGRAIRGQALVAKNDDFKGKELLGYLRPLELQPTEFDPFATASRIGLRIDQNGKFEGEAAPPGSYKVFVRPLRQVGEWPKPMSANLVVPEGNDPIDFGKIVMTNNVREFPISANSR
jgi:hypothetical protein